MLHKAVRRDFTLFIPFPYRINQVNDICAGLYCNRIFVKTKVGISFVPLQAGLWETTKKILKTLLLREDNCLG